MEMCVDNPREGFVDLFATHPAVADRVAALVKFAGGHDPGPIELAPPPQPAPEDTEPAPLPAPEPQPWGAPAPASGQPFLPQPSPLARPAAGEPGPWGPRER
jgi:heat shock protein HtpX